MCTRLLELIMCVKHVLFPPSLHWKDGDVLIVCDAIEAYRSLFTGISIKKLTALIKSAECSGVRIIFTRWNRTDKSRRDAIDKKGNWSDYVPHDQTELLHEIRHYDYLSFHVHHTNVFAHPLIVSSVGNCKRIVLAGSWSESCILNTARCCTEIPALEPCCVVKPASVGHSIMSFISMVQLQSLYADVTDLPEDCHVNKKLN